MRQPRIGAAQSGVLKSDLTGDDNLVPKMGLAPQYMTT